MTPMTTMTPTAIITSILKVLAMCDGIIDELSINFPKIIDKVLEIIDNFWKVIDNFQNLSIISKIYR